MEAAMAATNVSQSGDREASTSVRAAASARLGMMALAQQTPLLLLAEPTTHSDLPHQTELFWAPNNRRARSCLIVVLHDLNHACAAMPITSSPCATAKSRGGVLRSSRRTGRAGVRQCR
ncbi:hypothetical protein J4732_12135, partial [Serratia marcescens]|nr:hypothetical protein [Serratia marcescens]